MDAARWARIESLFHAAAALPDDAREAFLLRETDGDADLLAAVAGLLEEDARPHPVLDAGLAAAARDVLDAPGAAADLPAHAFGPYRAERLLGEGGMGVVYLARRADLDSVAAVKILRDASLSPARRERFAAEQRTLAHLNHPSIARLYDAGALADGTPWIAMEYVEGEPITTYCDSHRADVGERLRLFRAVCEAVQHAHEHAIIHRDLKPSNVLVRFDRAVRLLDFGIAKQLDALGEPEDATRTAFRALTPAYAAPEQLRGGPIGTHTDIYSLGVVLYELLAGRTPFEVAGLGPAELERLVSEREPERPSLAARRGGGRPPVTASRAAWADLDVLCLTAMHKDPRRRYRTADALVRDLDRFLAGDPLEARRDSVRYRLGKLVRRRWRPLAAAAAVVVTVAGLVGFYTVRLARARTAALEETARTQRIQSFMLSLFEGGDEDAGPGDTLRVVTLLDRGLAEARGLDAEPAVQAALFHTLAGLFQQLGRLERADSLYAAALERRRSLLGPVHADVARTEVAYGLLRAEQARYEDAERLVRAGLATAERTVPPGHPAHVQALVGLGRVLEERADYAGAIAVLDRAAALRATAPAGDADLAAALFELANAHFYAGHLDVSDSLNRRVLAMTRAGLGERHPSLADPLVNLGAAQFERGHYAEAERWYREALELTRSWYGDDHPVTAAKLTMLGRALVFQGRHDEAIAMLERALDICERVHGPAHPRVASALNEIANVALQRGRHDDAEPLYARMATIYRAAHGERHPLLAVALANLATVYLVRGDPVRRDFPRAEALFRDVVRRNTEGLGAAHMNTGIARIKLGRALLRQRRWAEAEAESFAGYGILVGQAHPGVSFLQAARTDLAAAYEALERPDAAARFRAEHAAVESTAAAGR